MPNSGTVEYLLSLSVLIHWVGNILFIPHEMARAAIATDAFTGTPARAHTHTKIQTRYTQYIITRTVTGETFRGEERGALNNECEEPCYIAVEPLK